MITEAYLAAPTMPPTRVDVERGADVVAVQLGIEIYTICWWYRIVIITECNESAWSYTAHVHISTVLLLVTFAWVSTKEVLTASVMSVTFHH